MKVSSGGKPVYVLCIREITDQDVCIVYWARVQMMFMTSPFSFFFGSFFVSFLLNFETPNLVESC